MTRATSPAPDRTNGNLPGHKGLSLWLWVGGAFAVLVLVWAVLFTVARSAKVESVPLTTKGAKP